MKLPIYQVDAFAEKVFKGNPAAVCPLPHWLSDELMQSIAQENNLSETAFFVQNNNVFDIRWFTPTVEVALCGHATLASAYVIFNLLDYSNQEIILNSEHSGVLKVTKHHDQLILNFPADVFNAQNLTPQLRDCFTARPEAVFKGKDDVMLIFKNQAEIEKLEPNLIAIARIEARGIIATAPGDEVDFVSRFFGPQSGVDEDPVTGSAHTTLTPYWAKRLGKNTLKALQLSKRTGKLNCEFLDNRVAIGGKAQLYMIGEIEVNTQ